MRCSGLQTLRLHATSDLCKRDAGILPAGGEGVPPACAAAIPPTRAKAPATAGDGPPSSECARITGTTHNLSRSGRPDGSEPGTIAPRPNASQFP